MFIFPYLYSKVAQVCLNVCTEYASFISLRIDLTSIRVPFLVKNNASLSFLSFICTLDRIFKYSSIACNELSFK